MELQQLYYIGELVGVTALVASLIFVGLQMRQNAKGLQANAAANMVSNWQEVMLSISRDATLSRDIIAVNTASSADDFTAEQAVRYLAFLSAGLKNTEYSYYRYLAGELDEGLWQASETGALAMFNTPLKKELFWPGVQFQLSPRFANYLEEKLAVGAVPENVPSIAVWIGQGR